MKTNPFFPENALILAPLSGYTDLPYRRSMRRHNCLFAFTEMIDAGSLVFGKNKTLRFLDRGNDEKWLGAQIVGSDIEMLAKAVKEISKYHFDLLDFNLGCPVPKVVKKGQGAALAKNIEKALRAFEIIKKHSKFPVSAKMRILDAIDPEPSIKLAKGLESAGASVITVHGRVQKQFYSGEVNYNIIREIKNNLKIQVVANGGINSLEKYTEMIKKTGISPVMLATGAMGNPWLFEEISNSTNYSPPTLYELADEIQRHISETCSYYGDEKALRISRKFIYDYLKGRGYSSELKNSVVKIKNQEELQNFLCEIRKGPSASYWKCLEKNPNAVRKLKMP